MGREGRHDVDVAVRRLAGGLLAGLVAVGLALAVPGPASAADGTAEGPIAMADALPDGGGEGGDVGGGDGAGGEPGHGAVALEVTFALAGADGQELAEGAVARELEVGIVVDGSWTPGAPPAASLCDADGPVVRELPCDWELSGGAARATARVAADIAADGTYRVLVEGVDEDGAEASARSVAFTLDTTPPELSLACPRQGARHEGVTYFDAPTSVTVRVDDANLDLAATTVDGQVATWERLPGRDATGVRAYAVTLPYGEGAAAVPEVRAVDLAGNVTVRSTLPDGSSALVVDLVAPVVEEVRSDGPAALSGDGAWWFYDRLATLSFSFADAWPIASATLYDPEGTYEGTVSYGDGRRSGTLQVTLVDGDGPGGNADFGRDVLLSVSDVAGNRRVWSLDRLGSVDDVVGSDAANASVNGWGLFPQALVADVTAPVVAVSGVRAGAPYAEPPVVRVEVVERNLEHLRRVDASRVVLRVTRRDGGADEPPASVWELPVSGLVGTGAAWACERALAADGRYELSAGLVDVAGNASNVVHVADVVVDTTAPVISVTFDGGDARAGRYYAAGRTARVCVDERNFDVALVDVETNGQVGAWSHDGDRHSCLVAFASDGSYRLSVRARDRAGNVARSWEGEEFVVDLTPPRVSIRGVVRQGAYRGAVAPVITCADETGIGEGDVSFSVTNAAGEVVTQELAHEVTERDGGLVIAFDDFAHEAATDGVYTVAASAGDRAGNRSEESLTFSVNRFGSTFVIDSVGDEGPYRAGGILRRAPEVVVREMGVGAAADPGTRSVVVTGPSGASRALERVGEEEGVGAFSGYVLSEHVGEGGWCEHVYRIGSGNFGVGGDEGRYLVNVISVDAAGNHNTTSLFYDRPSARAATAEVEFLLDTAGPSVELSLPSLEIADEYVGHFRVVDDVQSSARPDEVSVLVDGRELGAADLAGPDMAGSYAFRVAAAPLVSRSVEVLVTDHAGRAARVLADGLVVMPPWSLALAAAATAGAAALPLGLRRWRGGRSGIP